LTVICLPYGVTVVDRSCPQVSDQGPHQQSPQRVDDGGEGLVLGEPADPGWHRVWADKRTAGVCQQLEDKGEAVGARWRFAHQPEHRPHPRDRKGEQRDEAERRFNQRDANRQWTCPSGFHTRESTLHVYNDRDNVPIPCYRSACVCLVFGVHLSIGQFHF
jgi:hypothetical protein